MLIMIELTKLILVIQKNFADTSTGHTPTVYYLTPFILIITYASQFDSMFFKVNF